MNTRTPKPVHLIQINSYKGNREEVVNPIKTRGTRTYVSYIYKASVRYKWIDTDRIYTRPYGDYTIATGNRDGQVTVIAEVSHKDIAA